MDLCLSVLLVVLTLILLTVYVLNDVPRTDDLLAVFKALQRQNPSTVAFSLGHDRRTDRYRNVYTRPVADGDATDGGRIEAYVLWERNPVNTDGKYVHVDTGHGEITDTANGFSVAGVTGTQFTCPDGYEGSACRPSPLCDAEECAAAKIKPLTYTQFNALNLYRNTFARTSAGLTERTASGEATHPRVRVQCLRNGAYELQVCPDNKLLDPASVECREYDICQDRVNGYKHNYRVDGTSAALKGDEYYLCANNKSVLKTCGERTVFSAANQGCVVESVCFDRGKAQLRVDDFNYVQCRADSGHNVFCEHGVRRHESSGVLSCHLKTCKPYTSRYNDGTVDYAYARNVCDELDNAVFTACDNTSVGRTYSYAWAEPFQFSLAHWPASVLDEKTLTCVPPTDDIIVDTATVDLAWSPAMRTAHKFNVKRQEYECVASATSSSSSSATPTNYRWDYVTGAVVPALAGTDLFVDAAAPCQETAVANADTVWWTLANSHVGLRTVDTYPPNAKPPLVLAVRLAPGVIGPNDHLWPVYDSASKTYRGAVCEYDSEKAAYMIITYEDVMPPIGFAHVDKSRDSGTENSTVPLSLIGYRDFPAGVVPHDHNEHMYYFIASGKTEGLRFSSSAKSSSVNPISRIVDPPPADSTA